MASKKVEKNNGCECCDGNCNGKCVTKHVSNSGSSCAVYGLGLVGAVIYFFQHASTFTDYLWGIGKAIVWPAMLVYQAFELLK